MDPVKPPQHVGCEMDGGSIPVAVHIITHLLDFLRDEMGTDRPVFAAVNLHARRTPVAGISAYSIKRMTMKLQNCGRSKLEGPVRSAPLFDQLCNGVKLLESVSGFSTGLLVLVFDNVRGLSFAMAFASGIFSHCFPLTTRLPCQSSPG